MTSYMNDNSRPVPLAVAIANAQKNASEQASSSPEPSTPVPTKISSVPPAYPAFKAPPIPKADLTTDTMRAIIKSLPGFSLLRPINTKTVKAEGLPDGYSAPTVVNPVLTFSVMGYKGFDWSQIFVCTSERFTREQRAAAADLARQCYAGSGCAPALFRRMRAQLPPANKQSGPSSTEEMEFMLSVLPRTAKSELSGEGATPLGVSPAMNLKAHPGAPYFKSGVSLQDVLLPSFHLATKYLLILEEGGAGALAEYAKKEENAHEFVMLLSAKSDIYLRSDYFTKVRPFGVVPAALRILFSCISSSIKGQQHTFLTHPDSISALGFSWMHGGTQELLYWIGSPHSDEKKWLKHLCYGDDQIMRVECEDGTVFVICPDVSGMDMKVNAHTFNLAFIWLLSQFHDEKLTFPEYLSADGFRKILASQSCTIDERWFSAIQYLIHYAKSHPVLMYKHLMALQQMGLLSGLNLTTWFDIIASTRIGYAIRNIKRPKTVADIPAFRAELVALSAGAGYPFKADSLDVQVMNFEGGAHTLHRVDGTTSSLPPTTHLALPFLGMCIYEYTVPADLSSTGKALSFPVPCMDTSKAIAHLVLKVSPHSLPTKREAHYLQQVLGISLMAGANDGFYDYAASNFNTRMRMGYRLPKSGMGTPHDTIPFDLDDLSKIDSFPNQSYLMKIFASPEIQELITIEKPSDIDSLQPSEGVEEPPEPEVEEPDIISLKQQGALHKGARQPGGDVNLLSISFKSKSESHSSSSQSASSKPPKALPKKAPDEEVLLEKPSSKIPLPAKQALHEHASSATKLAPPKPLPQEVKPPTITDTEALQAPPVAALRLANAARHKVKADAKYEKAMAALAQKIANEGSKVSRLDRFLRSMEADDPDYSGLVEDRAEALAAEHEHKLELERMRQDQLQEDIEHAYEEERLKELAHRVPDDLASDDEAIQDEDDSETEEERYADPTQSKAHQAAAWFRGD